MRDFGSVFIRLAATLVLLMKLGVASCLETTARHEKFADPILDILGSSPTICELWSNHSLAWGDRQRVGGRFLFLL